MFGGSKPAQGRAATIYLRGEEREFSATEGGFSINWSNRIQGKGAKGSKLIKRMELLLEHLTQFNSSKLIIEM